MVITLNLFLYLYFAIFAIYTIFALFNLWHMVKFALNRYAALMGMFVYVGGILLIMGFTMFFILQINWSAEISLFNLSNNYYSPYAK